MNPDWLSQLAPGHAPPPPAWWPPAPGWWAAFALLVILAALGIALWRSPSRVMRRAALRELSQIRAANSDTVETARAIQSLLRRYALAVFGVDSVAHLTGKRWLHFISSRSRAPVDEAVGDSLLGAAFGAPHGDHRQQWLALATDFVRRGRP